MILCPHGLKKHADFLLAFQCDFLIRMESLVHEKLRHSSRSAAATEILFNRHIGYSAARNEADKAIAAT